MSNFTNETFNKYIPILRKKCFKILPLFEEMNDGIFKYINSLISEIHGLQYIVDNQYLIISIIATLENLLDEQIATEYDLPFIRSEVFKCSSLIEKLEMKGE